MLSVAECMRGAFAGWHRPRAALGLDLAPDRLLALLLCADPGHPVATVEHARCVALPPGVLQGAEICDPDALRTALVEALSDSLGGFIEGVTGRGARIALSIPDSAMTKLDLALPQGTLSRIGGRAKLPGDLALDALEEFVASRLEVATRVESEALSLDWFVLDESLSRLRAVACEQRHVDARLEWLSGLGLELSLLDTDACAGLRACRVAACMTLGSGSWRDSKAVSTVAPAPGRGEPGQSPPSKGLTVKDGDGQVPSAKHGPRQAVETASCAAAADRYRRAGAGMLARLTGAHLGAPQPGLTPRSIRGAYMTLWLQDGGGRLEAFDAHGQPVAEPLGSEWRSLEALRTLLSSTRRRLDEPVACAVMGGESVHVQAHGGVRALSDMLECPVYRFDAGLCAMLGDGVEGPLANEWASAFGLAWRALCD